MKLGEMKKDVNVHMGTCENVFGNWTEKAFNAEGKRIFKIHPEYEYLKEDPHVEDEQKFYHSVLYAYMKDCVLKKHPEFQNKYNEIQKKEIFAAKGLANYFDKFKGKEDKVYWMTNSGFLSWYDDYTRELADPGVLERERKAREDKELTYQAIARIEQRKKQEEVESGKRVVCPYCKSTNTEKISTMSRAVSVSLVGAASGKLGKQWHCNNCKSDF